MKENFAYAQKTIEEGSITTQVFAEAFKTTSGDTVICVGMIKFDSSTDTYLTDFEHCGPDLKIVLHEQGMNRDASGSLNISGDLTFSTDDATGKIAKVNSGYIQIERV